MALKIIVISFLSAVQYQLVSSQCLRQFGRGIIESPRIPRNIITQPRFINSPCSSQNIITTDCTPSVCQNLADTLQLMIVCNLLQNTNGCGCNDVNAVLPCGCGNGVTPSFISPRAIPNVISPSVISPSVISPSVISPNVISPSVFSSDFISPVSVSNPYRFSGLLGC